MQKQNGYKFLEKSLALKGKLNKLDLKDLGITPETAKWQETQWKRNDLSVIPSSDEKKPHKK